MEVLKELQYLHFVLCMKIEYIESEKNYSQLYRDF